MDSIIQVGRKCSVKIRPESGAAIQYGEEVYGTIKGKDEIDIKDEGTLDTLYFDKFNKMSVIVVEDECGIDWRVPEMDVEKIVCETE